MRLASSDGRPASGRRRSRAARRGRPRAGAAGRGRSPTRRARCARPGQRTGGGTRQRRAAQQTRPAWPPPRTPPTSPSPERRRAPGWRRRAPTQTRRGEPAQREPRLGAQREPRTAASTAANTAAAAHVATRRRRAGPRRGRACGEQATRRPGPMTDAGTRSQSTDVAGRQLRPGRVELVEPAERRLGRVEPAVDVADEPAVSRPRGCPRCSRRRPSREPTTAHTGEPEGHHASTGAAAAGEAGANDRRRPVATRRRPSRTRPPPARRGGPSRYFSTPGRRLERACRCAASGTARRCPAPR